MRAWHSVIAVFLLLTLTLPAQDSSNPSSSSATAQTPDSGTQSSAPEHQPPSAAAEPGAAAASAAPASAAPLTMNQVVDRVIEREHSLMNMLKTRTPVVETYLQNFKSNSQAGPVPAQDHYFLGRVGPGETIQRRDYLSRGSDSESLFTGLFKTEYNPLGFASMIFVDREDFDRQTYDFHYTRREFLGDVRCMVFDVSAKKGTGDSRFRGRIWVEDQNYNIVRLNGTYAPRPHHTFFFGRDAYYFHMDSWRLNLVPGYWVPTYIYTEQGDFSSGSSLKAQTRLWGYASQTGATASELTQIQVDSTVRDVSPAAQDYSPLEAQRQWQLQAENNVMDRLQNAGLLAPVGEVDKVLLTVVNNLIISNNLELLPPVRTRLLLTTPLETFGVGNTIVVSRGLVDVLPDEASLAMVLAHELAHVVLGHNSATMYTRDAFSDRMWFPDESTYQEFDFRHSEKEETAADQKALELLEKSPYAQKLDTAGLFLRELAERAPKLSRLLTPRLGNSFVDKKGGVTRMVVLMNSAPALDLNKLDQIVALPLGGRVKLNPWNDQAELVKASTVTLVSPRDKMPLEVAPFFPRLTRYGAVGKPALEEGAANRTPKN